MRLEELVDRIRNTETPRTEATLQADVRQLLLEAPIGLDESDLREVNLEAPLGDRRRIDIETGTCVIEVKKRLLNPRVVADAVDQLQGYLQVRRSQTGLRYVGILTDGFLWICYHLRGETAEEVTRLTLSSGVEGESSLLIWLEGVLATAQDIPPTPENIGRRLGSGSSSHQLDRKSLASLYLDNRSLPTVAAKRKLWARLLTTALGTSFEDTDDLFIEHSLLVLSAEVIAHAVLELDPAQILPKRLVTGEVFDEAGVYGVVEADFFDWVVEVPGGETWLRTLAKRLKRFRWEATEHDVLKVLYESVINPDTRKKLGEYYTPDWLADQVVDEVFDDPLNQRLLDPACGSGTFLFQAVRKYLAVAEDEGLSVSEALEGVTRQVIGLDLHPVAVTLARVTYLLAIGRSRVAGGERGALRIPVYLGDSLQWQFSVPNLWTAGTLSIKTDSGPDLFDSELLFPETLLAEPHTFDSLVEDLAHAADARGSDGPPDMEGIFDRFGVSEVDRPVLRDTFEKLCHLCKEGRDHIWSYYVRNLARPTWLSKPENRVDVLVGNPPWLAYRNMTVEMQAAFRAMSSDRGLWQGAGVAPHQDLSALFVARAIELYLRPEGVFGMVVPNAALDRAQYAGFRAGKFGDHPSGPVSVTFGQPWDLRRIRPHFFPRGAAVVFGERSAHPNRMPETVEAWSGKLGNPYAGWEAVSTTVVKEPAVLYPSTSLTTSKYRGMFSQGAALSPRCLFVVEPDESGPLGVPKGHRRVRSSRSANEKPPWKNLPDRSGVVEGRFVHELVAGEVLVPYRTYRKMEVVLPVLGGEILVRGSNRLGPHPRLGKWWREAEAIWEEHRSSDRLSLAEQMDYRQKLSKQLEPVTHRVIYSKSGMHMVAARLELSKAVVNDSLYWARVGSEDEALYLCAILNSKALTDAVRPLMSYGKDERHFDKYVWQLGIPEFSPASQVHEDLAHLGREIERFVAELSIPTESYFVTARQRVRSEISSHPAAAKLETTVSKILAN